MELTVFEGGEPIGMVQAEEDGLFYRFFCKIQKNVERIRRVYVVSLWRVEYLGIPYPQGGAAELTVRIPVKHFPDGLTGAVSTQQPKGLWLPWCGQAGGVSVRDGWLRPSGEDYDLALPPREAQNFPEWLPQAGTETLMGVPMAVFSLDAAGNLPPIEIDNGGMTDETETFSGAADVGLPDDPAAGDSFGGEYDELRGGQGPVGEEADCPDL